MTDDPVLADLWSKRDRIKAAILGTYPGDSSADAIAARAPFWPAWDEVNRRIHARKKAIREEEHYADFYGSGEAESR